MTDLGDQYYRNIQFGSRQEVVSLFDGKSFEYFTTNEGLSDHQIHSIQEDNNDELWFVMAKGNVFMLNVNTFVKQF